MLEIEIKAPLPDLARTRSLLIELGAERLEERRQVDLYFAHPCRDFGRTDEALRLRSDGGRQVMTYKGPKLDARSKTREEIEQPVDYERMSITLRRLGFRDFMKVEKRRSDYRLDQVIVSLDRVTGLGDYIELEVEDDDRERGLRRIQEIKDKLRVEGNETRSYLELLMSKKEMDRERP